jgi:AN1-type zinc finger and ubiquitin domain-containing protein 1
VILLRFHSEGIPVDHQHIIFAGIELNDDATLDSYGVSDSASLKLVVTMKGGPVKIRRAPTGAVDPSWVEMRDLIEISE